MGVPSYDCQRCGACCTNPDENRASGFLAYVDVLPTDRLLDRATLVRRFVVTDGDGRAHVRLDGTGRCVALVGRVGRHAKCGIYADRPRGCRLLEAGSERCISARRERGITAEASLVAAASQPAHTPRLSTTQLPVTITRSPAISTPSSPPRSERCAARSLVRPRRVAQ